MTDETIDDLLARLNVIDAADNGSGLTFRRDATHPNRVDVAYEAGDASTQFEFLGVDNFWGEEGIFGDTCVEVLSVRWADATRHRVLLGEGAADTLYRLALGHLVDHLGFAD